MMQASTIVIICIIFLLFVDNVPVATLSIPFAERNNYFGTYDHCSRTLVDGQPDIFCGCRFCPDVRIFLYHNGLTEPSSSPGLQ
jgi:hypothetical protein